MIEEASNRRPKYSSLALRSFNTFSASPSTSTTPVIDDIAAVGNRQRLTLAVVGQQDRDPGVAEVGNDILNVVDGDWIDPGERFVEQDNAGPTR